MKDPKQPKTILLSYSLHHAPYLLRHLRKTDESCAIVCLDAASERYFNKKKINVMTYNDHIRFADIESAFSDAARTIDFLNKTRMDGKNLLDLFKYEDVPLCDNFSLPLLSVLGNSYCLIKFLGFLQNSVDFKKIVIVNDEKDLNLEIAKICVAKYIKPVFISMGAFYSISKIVRTIAVNVTIRLKNYFEGKKKENLHSGCRKKIILNDNMPHNFPAELLSEKSYFVKNFRFNEFKSKNKPEKKLCLSDTKEALEKFLKLNLKTEQFYYQNIFIGDFICKNLKKSFESFVYSSGAIRLFFDKFLPDLLAISDETNSSFALSMEAKKRNIPILRISNTQDIDWVHVPIPKHYTYYCAGSKYIKENWVKAGIPLDKVIETGYKKWTDAPYENKFDKSTIYKELNIQPDKKILLFTLQNNFDKEKAIIETLNEIMKELPGLHLVIRPHPWQGWLKIRMLLGTKPTNISVTKNGSFWRIMNASEALITNSSLTGFEAMLIKKPVIVFKDDWHACQKPYYNGAALWVPRLSGLKNAIEKVIYDEHLRESLRLNSGILVEQYKMSKDVDFNERFLGTIESILA